ncbi:MAG: hypothetical protein HOV80_03960 [Polyangiaceae bacterium]|nr:hypothetical protein [Polyangiaceae bacterium]
MTGWLRWIHGASVAIPAAIAVMMLIASSHASAAAIVAGLFSATYVFFRWRARQA